MQRLKKHFFLLQLNKSIKYVHNFLYCIYPPLSEHCVMKGIIHGEVDEKTSEERKNVVENPAGSEIHMSKL